MAFVNAGGPTNSPTTTPTNTSDNAMDILEGLGIDGSSEEGETEGSTSEESEDTSNHEGDVDNEDVENELLGDGTKGPLEMEIKGDKKAVKFKLDPNDKDLKRTLEWGLAAPRFVRERKEAKQQLDELQKSSAILSEKASRIDEVQELIASGRHNLAVKTLLGEEAYKKYYADTVLKRVKYDTADSDEERNQIAQQFRDEEREDERHLSGRERNKLLSANQELISKEEGRLQRATAVSEHARYRFDEVDSDPAVQEAMSGKLWKLAMADIEEWVGANEGKVKPTKEHYRKAFQENYKFLIGSRKSADTKREVATTQKAQTSEKKKAGNIAKGGAQVNENKFDKLGIFDRLDWLKSKG